METGSRSRLPERADLYFHSMLLEAVPWGNFYTDGDIETLSACHAECGSLITAFQDKPSSVYRV